MKKVELAQFLENIVKEDSSKPDLERYANSIYCAYTKEEILKVIGLYEKIPRCDTIKESIANAKTYRVLFMLEKIYGKGSVETLISCLKKKLPTSNEEEPVSTKKFSDIKLDLH